MTTILDPTNEQVPVERQLAKRHSEIIGSLALLDISKPRGVVLIDALEEMLTKQLPKVTINRYAKPTFTKPAPEALRKKIKAENDFVIEALADWGSCTTCSLHDTVWFEIQGLASVTIASEEFKEAAATQAKALGLEDAPCVFVEHPIQDATDEQLHKKAQMIINEVIDALKA